MKIDRQKYWVKRIVANGWDNMGAGGVAPYLKKYGKNIGKDKILAIARLCRNEGCSALADGFEAAVSTATQKINLPPSLTRPKSKSNIANIFTKTWCPAEKSTTTNGVADHYIVFDSILKKLIKQKTFTTDDKRGSGFGKPLLPSHNYQRFIRADDFVEGDEDWSAWVESVKYTIIKNK